MNESEIVKRLDIIEAKIDAVLNGRARQVGATKPDVRTWDEIKSKAYQWVLDMHIERAEVCRYRDFQIRAYQEVKGTDHAPEDLLRELLAEGKLEILVANTDGRKRYLCAMDAMTKHEKYYSFLDALRLKDLRPQESIWTAVDRDIKEFERKKRLEQQGR